MIFFSSSSRIAKARNGGNGGQGTFQGDLYAKQICSLFLVPFFLPLILFLLKFVLIWGRGGVVCLEGGFYQPPPLFFLFFFFVFYFIFNSHHVVIV